MRRFCLTGLLTLVVLSPALQARSAIPPAGPITTLETEHLTLVASVSNESVAPGEQFSLVFDITPKRGIHVYAPGKHTYQIVRFTLDPQSSFRPHSLTYPKSEIYHFEPLDERVEVYQRAFTLVQDVTVVASSQARESLAAQIPIKISGRLEYQACDNTLCYAPKTVPVSWTIDWREN
jgi:DsbC/DsbD-like thiol-disulfide interchange protein